jgi:ureidoacrylate peracid hydrolase
MHPPGASGDTWRVGVPMSSGRPAAEMDSSIELGRDTALLIVDMQNGFCHQKGSAELSGLDVAVHRAISPRIAELVEATRRAEIPVFWSRQEHFENDVGRLGHRILTHIQKGGYLPCLRGTWDSEIYDELAPLVIEDDVVFTKHRASCFFNTTLEPSLRMRGITTLVVAGVTTNYCVDSTIRDAYARDYDLLIVEDACAATYRDLHEATLKNAALFHGQVLPTTEVVKLLDAIPVRAAEPA